MDTIGLRVPTKENRDFFAFNISNVSRLIPLIRCVTAAKNICKSLEVFNKYNISIEDTFSLAWSELHHYRVACFILLPSVNF
jgi:hypothetical protein